MGRLTVLNGLLQFLWKRKVWWLVPIVVLLMLVALLIFIGQSAAVSSFVYALF
ncbi:MAG: DUF5989 family protein [Candidatus Diapherotrites archaeon]